MPKETALITGASSGIGLELANLFAADKSDLVLVARRKDLLEKFGGEIGQKHGGKVRVLAKDLADPAAPRAIFDELAADDVQVDVLVNNAGFGAVGDFVQLPIQRQMDMLQVNVTALTHLTGLFLPPMVERGRGGILNVGSTAGFQPGPYMAVYYATKAYVLSFTEALAEEMEGKGIHVTCLAPGATNTGFAAEAKMLDSPLFRSGSMDVRPVAEAGYRGFRAGNVIVVPGLKNRVGAASVRFAPRRIVRKIAARLNRWK